MPSIVLQAIYSGIDILQQFAIKTFSSMKESDCMNTYIYISIVIGFILTIATYAKNIDDLIQRIVESDRSGLIGIGIGALIAFAINVLTWPIYVLLEILIKLNRKELES